MLSYVPVKRSRWWTALVMAASLLGLVPPLSAQEVPSPPSVQQTPREKELRDQLKKILEELDEIQHRRDRELPPEERTPSVIKEKLEPADQEKAAVYNLEDVSIVSDRIQKHPEGITLSATPRSEYDSRPTRQMRESLESLPGVITRQANGPRDFSISIRGSGTKTTFAIRDLKVYEDGIIQTQSDGLSRLDLQDPWFMKSVEVTRGASSSMYDNYALGGMVQFRTRRGGDINGVESFFSGGSFGYQKYAFAVGQETSKVDVALFGSNVAEDGFINHSAYNTQTMNFNVRYRMDDKQSFYFKAITNWLNTQVPTRLTINQFNANDRQAGGTTCTNVNSCNNAIRLAQGRLDRRTIIGGLYERELGPHTVLTIEADYDVKDIDQRFTQITVNENPNYKNYVDLRHDGRLAEMPLKSYVGFFVNNMEQKGNTFVNLDDFFATRGTLAQNNRVTIRNIGARFREELEFVPKWIVAAGLGYENSNLSALVTNYNTTGAAAGQVSSRINIDRTWDNWAPELSLTFKPNETFRNWVRASTGYGIPQVSNLTTGPNGLAGVNQNVKPQKNLNLEVGTDSKVHETLALQLVGFWIYFKDEIISQTISTTGGSYAVNAPSSQYRGIEASYDWRPAAGLRFSGAYTHIWANYIHFTDNLAPNGVGPVQSVNQNGHQVPNVVRDVLNFKEEYEHASGWGAWLQTSYWNSYFLNNANSVAAPAYWLLNANIHKNFDIKNIPYVRFAKFYAELDNILDKTYVASGNVVSDSTPDAQKTLFYAGYGRAFYAGVTLGLF
jgi:iron complex outermembrane receptor protein